MILNLIILTVSVSRCITLPLPSPALALRLPLAESVPVLAPHLLTPSVVAVLTLAQVSS